MAGTRRVRRVWRAIPKGVQTWLMVAALLAVVLTALWAWSLVTGHPTHA